MDDISRATLHNTLHVFGLQASEAKSLFESACVVVKYPKNTLLFREAQPNHLEYLLLEGVMHRFNTDQDGRDITTGFYSDKAVVTPHFARTVGGKSIFALQALTDITVAEIPVKSLDHLRYSHPAFQQFGQRVIEAEFSHNLMNDVAFRSGSASFRLALFRQHFPGLENLIPHFHIATYLGITQVSFSRLRREKHFDSG